MEILIQGLVGVVLVPVYNFIKGKLNLNDASAAWVMMLLTLMLAFPLALFTGQFAGIVFDIANPLVFLAAVGKAFLVLLGAAEGLYMLTKKRG